MIAFQILDEIGNPMSLQSLDIQVTKFWKLEVGSKWYAEPNKESLGSWFDTIGWSIGKQTDYLNWGLNTWNTVKSDMLSIHIYAWVVLSPEEAGIRACNTMRKLKPYFELIDHWEAMGYKPKQIKE
jgi:hypothetical protein